MTNPHDNLFHYTFGKPRHAEGWLRSVLPQSVAAAVAWESLRQGPERIDSHELRLLVADVVHFAELLTGVGLGVLLEHWSSSEGPVRQRVLRYAVHLGDAGRLLLVVVLYHGERPWTGVDPWDAVLAGLEPEAARAIGQAQARVVLFVDDLTRCSEPALRRKLLTALAQLTLLCLRFLRDATVEQAFEALDRWGDLLRAVDRDTGEGSGVEAIERISCYFLRVTGIPAGILHAAFERILQRPENTIMSTAEKLMKEGEARGEARGEAKLLLQLLTKRFGALPAATVERVKSALLPDLDRWFERALDVKTIDDVFAAQ